MSRRLCLWSFIVTVCVRGVCTKIMYLRVRGLGKPSKEDDRASICCTLGFYSGFTQASQIPVGWGAVIVVVQVVRPSHPVLVLLGYYSETP